MAFTLSGCGVYFTNCKVENHSDHEMVNVVFVYTGGHYGMGTLRPGMASRFFGRIDRGEAYSVEFDWRGKRRSVDGCYYDIVGSSGGMTITNNGVEVRCDGEKQWKAEICEKKPDTRRLRRSTAADLLPQAACP